jgi:hypothetical protein
MPSKLKVMTHEHFGGIFPELSEKGNFEKFSRKVFQVSREFHQYKQNVQISQQQARNIHTEFLLT